MFKADSRRPTRSAARSAAPAQFTRSCSRQAYGTTGLPRVPENNYGTPSMAHSSCKLTATLAPHCSSTAEILDIMGTKDVEIHTPALIQIIRRDKHNFLAQSLVCTAIQPGILTRSVQLIGLFCSVEWRCALLSGETSQRQVAISS